MESSTTILSSLIRKTSKDEPMFQYPLFLDIKVSLPVREKEWVNGVQSEFRNASILRKDITSRNIAQGLMIAV